MLDRLTRSLHYGRARRRESWRPAPRLWILVPALTMAGMSAASALAQYPGQIAKKDKEEAPALRAVAVLEWTGDLGKPKTSRLVPVTVFDGEQLQDGAEYLARPEPLAVAGGVEYVLQRDGARVGLFDIQSASQDQGSWVGFGSWKPMPSLKPKVPDVAQKIDDDESSDRPVLHRKKGSGNSGSDSGSGAAGSPPDPDRPTLHKKPADEDAGGDAPAGAPASGDGSATGSQPAPAGGKSGGADAGSPSASASDRPPLKRGKAKAQADEGYVESTGTTDPDRPRLLRGKSTGGFTDEATPTLVGLPAGMEQAVAVSDPRNRPEHPWNFAWASPDDEPKMKAELEDAARKALGLEPAAAPPHKTAAASRTRAASKPAPPAEPPPLLDEEFRVFELAYGSGATLVLSAHTPGSPAEQKFVTLIAQPDLYGSLLILFKSLTDGAHLDEKPRMRLVDAVDALADNRGELLFELRGSSERQFALYRVLRGTAKELFVTGGGATSPGVAN